MSTDDGVMFPISDASGSRSSAAFSRAVIADALLGTPAASPQPDVGTTGGGDWRKSYPAAFRTLVTAGLASPADAVRIARQGLDSTHSRLAIDLADHGDRLDSTTTHGDQRPVRRISIPDAQSVLTGAALDRKLDGWLAHGVIEPSCAEAVRTVAAHPEWLDLSDLTFVVVGAGAEMGPVASLLSWGADVVAVDLPRPRIWERLQTVASSGAGRLHAVQVDVTRRPGALAQWLAERDLRGRRMVLGNYLYAPGASHLIAAAAMDAVTGEVLGRREDVSLAILGTPTDTYAVPSEVVSAARDAYDRRGGLRATRSVLGAVSRGALAHEHYPAATHGGLGGLGGLGGFEEFGDPDPSAPAGLTDSLVLQQGPNYAMAKRVQRWRATAARADKVAVSYLVAPPSRTRSVTSHRLLRAAYDGAHRFGVEVFDPATSNALMATLLVHDLRNPQIYDAPWQHETHAAAHGGLWRQGYVPRTVLGLAVGVGARSLLRR
jgi:hypothetical protein